MLSLYLTLVNFVLFIVEYKIIMQKIRKKKPQLIYRYVDRSGLHYIPKSWHMSGLNVSQKGRHWSGLR